MTWAQFSGSHPAARKAAWRAHLDREEFLRRAERRALANRVRRMVAQGIAVNDIAAELGVHRATVWRLRANG